MAKKPLKISQERLEELEDIKALIATRPGARFLKRLLRITGPYRPVFDPDMARMAWLEGNRNFGCRIIVDLLEACPEQYVRLIVETNIKQEEKETKHEIHKFEQDDEAADN